MQPAVDSECAAGEGRAIEQVVEAIGDDTSPRFKRQQVLGKPVGAFFGGILFMK